MSDTTAIPNDKLVPVYSAMGIDTNTKLGDYDIGLSFVMLAGIICAMLELLPAAEILETFKYVIMNPLDATYEQWKSSTVVIGSAFPLVVLLKTLWPTVTTLFIKLDGRHKTSRTMVKYAIKNGSSYDALMVNGLLITLAVPYTAYLLMTHNQVFLTGVWVTLAFNALYVFRRSYYIHKVIHEIAQLLYARTVPDREDVYTTYKLMMQLVNKMFPRSYYDDADVDMYDIVERRNHELDEAVAKTITHFCNERYH